LTQYTRKKKYSYNYLNNNYVTKSNFHDPQIYGQKKWAPHVNFKFGAHLRINILYNNYFELLNYAKGSYPKAEQFCYRTGSVVPKTEQLCSVLGIILPGNEYFCSVLGIVLPGSEYFCSVMGIPLPGS
jgi:hypothetical protein